MTYNEQMHEIAYPLANLYPANKSVATHQAGYVSLKNYHRAWVVLEVGTIPTGATVDLALYEATDTSGSGEQAISGKEITQLTDSDDNALCCIELQTEEMDVADSYDCLAAKLTIGDDTVYASLIIYGVEPRFEPVPTSNWQETID